MLINSKYLSYCEHIVTRYVVTYLIKFKGIGQNPDGPFN